MSFLIGLCGLFCVSWMGLQLIVVSLALTSEWAVRRSAPGANRWLRRLLITAVACGLSMAGLVAVASIDGLAPSLSATLRTTATYTDPFVQPLVDAGTEVVRLVPFSTGSNAGAGLETSANTGLSDGASAITPSSALASIAASPLASTVCAGIAILLAASILLGLALVVRQIRRQHDRIDAASPLLTVGRLTLAVHPSLAGPCAVLDLRPLARFSRPRAVILLDARTGRDRSEQGRNARDLAVRHELTHLRHGDLQAALVSSLIVAVSIVDPFAWRLARNLAELDEHLVDRTLLLSGVSPRAYGRLLLAVHSPPPTPFPASMPAPGLAHTTPLHRRLHMLDRNTLRSSARWPFVLAALVTLTGPVTLGLTALSIVDNPAQAKPSDTRAPKTPSTLETPSTLDAVDHPLVDAAHARLTATDKGRRFVRRAFERRPTHLDLLHTELDAAGLPTALEAVVFIESAYDDQLSTDDLRKGDSAAPTSGPIGGGLWMFIPRTARTYGLTVTEDLDERLDPVLETDAAIALLTDLHDEFGDWGLALAGYNQGAAHVRKAIETHGTRDVMRLVEIGPEDGGLNGYVPMVWAAARVLDDRAASEGSERPGASAP